MGKQAELCPNQHGGKNWPPIAFNPQTRMIYVPANNNICGSLTGVPATYTAGGMFTGAKSGGAFLNPGADHIGEVQAWNVDTGLSRRSTERAARGRHLGVRVERMTRHAT